uniref:Uncharacterized protein n=1 Tax=Cajanus cajan TaxID=3821 RepID=A0A151UHX8_CAJCA|nr:hypothetical protein KK1_029488 [Cajanus cajan]
MASKLFSKASHLQSKARLEDSVVCALCTSFREGRNWDAVTREFGALELNDSSVEQVLLHLNSPTDAKAALGFFHWAAKRHNGFQHATRSYCIAIHLLLGARGHVAESERDVVVLLKRLLQKNLLHETVVYSLIVHAKVVFGDLDSARGLFMEMVRRGFEGNAFVYNSFIGAFCRDGRIEEAVGLMREMEGKGLEPYGETFEHILVGCAADSERLEECLRAFEEMVKVGFVPGCLVFNEVVERLCERGYVEKANEMLTVLLDRGFLPNDVTYCRLMQGYAEKEEVQEVLKLYYEMEYRSVSPGLLVFVAIIRCLCRCGKVEDAERYLRIMKGRSVSPDVTVYEALIDGYAKKGDSGKAICLREEMASLVL